MEDSRPSRTALRVAIRRAAHQLLDRPLVFEDPLAVRILDSQSAAVLTTNREQFESKESTAFRAFFVARARYAEDQLAVAFENRVRQFVVLGAGLDTFAYRNPYAAAGLRVFEVDHPATQQWKRYRLEQAGIAIPDSLTFAPVHFETQTLESGLTNAGFNFSQPTFFSWLGVTMYLTDEAFRSTVSLIASLPEGSGVAFDYAVDAKVLSDREKVALEMLGSRVAAIGEPFRLFFTPDGLRDDLEMAGFRQIEDLGSQEMNTRYFENRQDHLKIAGNGGRLACAWR